MIKRRWVKRWCESNACVEVMESDDEILVRQSNNPRRILAFTREEWANFVAGTKEGLFDLSE